MRASRRPASLLARLTAPTIRYVDSEGARLRGDLFAVGSGGEYAYGVLDAVAHGRRELAEDGATADRAGGGGRDGGLAELDAEQAVAVALEARSAPGRGASGATVSVTVSSPTPSSRAVQALAASTARDAYSGGFVNGARVPRFSRARSRGPNQRAFPICPPRASHQCSASRAQAAAGGAMSCAMTSERATGGLTTNRTPRAWSRGDWRARPSPARPI